MADDAISHQRAISRAARAKALAEDDILKEAFTAFEDELMSLWRGTKMDATAERERVWIMLKAIGRIRQHLQTVISDGKVSAAILEDLVGRNAA